MIKQNVFSFDNIKVINHGEVKKLNKIRTDHFPLTSSGCF